MPLKNVSEEDGNECQNSQENTAETNESKSKASKDNKTVSKPAPVRKKRHVIATKDIRKLKTSEIKQSAVQPETTCAKEETTLSKTEKSSQKDDDKPPSEKVNDLKEPTLAVVQTDISTNENSTSHNLSDKGTELNDVRAENVQNTSKTKVETSSNSSDKDKKETKKLKTTKKNKESASRKRGVKSHVLTDYFPVRRSSRKPKSLLQKEQDDQIIEAISSKCEDGLSVVEFEGKGRGVVAKRAFKKGSFIVEYAGDLVDWTEAKRRESEYGKDPSIGCYMYYFVFENVNYCVDATAESGRLGRLLNHSRKNPNCKTKLVGVPDPKGKGVIPRLVIIAKKDIHAGDELTYDYGDRDKDTLQSHPWLKST